MIYEIVVDRGETPNKCTIAPLASRPDFRLFPVFGEGPLGPLSAPILLHHEGVCLTTLRSKTDVLPALACIDCVWRRLPFLMERTRWVDDKAPVLARIPDGFSTVYPRVGSAYSDPQGGLATIEAIFVAAAILGNYDPTLLSKYYFGRRFIETNAKRFLELGIDQVQDPDLLPLPPVPERNSMTRRKNRGQAP